MLDKISYDIIGAAIEVHKALGPGLLESAYETCLAHELMEKELKFERQYPLQLEYKGRNVDCCYRLDFLVEDAIVVELKAIEVLQPIHEAQLITYLKISGKKVGMLINFNVRILKEGLRRIVV